MLLRLRRAGIRGQALRQFVPRVPELARAVVLQALQDKAGGREDIGWQHGLPNGEDPDLGARVPIENLLDCGGPPQAGGSGRREERDHPVFIFRPVELGFQRLHGPRVHFGQRRLAGGCVVGEQAGACGDYQPQSEHDSSNQKNGGTSHSGKRSASRLATTWGMRIIASTSTAQTQKIARLSGLRRWQTLRRR